jgi:hypothetical protein
MSRHLLFVLLLATSVALADDRPKAKQAAGSAKSKTEAAQGQTKKSQAKTEAAPRQTKEAQTRTETVQERTSEAQPATEAPQAETEQTQPQAKDDPKLTSVPGSKALGMSILGNQDAPKSLVIVPWKSSELGNSPGIAPMLDESRQPVDKEVFMRALCYYEIRSEKKP